MFSRLNICMYGLHICIYSDLHPFKLTKLHIYIYIYIYIQHKTPKHRVQVTGAAGSCSQHGIMRQRSPLEAIVGYYQETS